MKTWKALTAAIALAVAMPALAQLPHAQDVPPGGMTSADTDFLQRAAADNITQIMLARTAAKKTKNGGVHELADAIASSHTKANDALKLLAGAKHVDLPNQPSSAGQAEVDDLNANHGADVDRQYVSDVLRDNDALIVLYEDVQDHSPDADVRAHAATMLPALREHRQRAQNLLASALGH